MRNAIRALLLAILTVGFAAAASAQDSCSLGCDPFYQDPPPDASGTTGGAGVYYCAAKGSWGGYCRACVSVNGIRTCGDSNYSAKCECSGACNPYKGSCTYEK